MLLSRGPGKQKEKFLPRQSELLKILEKYVKIPISDFKMRIFSKG
jgi:septum formation topological specificity factor MinE